MDQLITIKEGAKFLKKSPSLSPRLDFTKVALKQLECPQSPEPHPRMEQPCHGPGPPHTSRTQGICPSYLPRDHPVYPQFAAPAINNMIDNMFEWNKNYYFAHEHQSSLFPHA
jgi:hypothetical protein